MGLLRIEGVDGMMECGIGNRVGYFMGVKEKEGKLMMVLFAVGEVSVITHCCENVVER